jgi:antitoxin CptB
MNERLAKLKWRSRRGMRELDAVLRSFLDTADVAQWTESDFARFEAILDLPDPTLLSYFSGRSEPAEPAIAELVARIRAAHRPSP